MLTDPPADVASNPARAIKGRGAHSNPQNRFHQQRSVSTSAEWFENLVQVSPATELIADHAKTIISTNKSPDIPFTQSINPYKGCEHGCVYCYARPTHEYLELSPGLDFETKIFYKPGAASLLRKAFEAPSYQCSPIMLGANTDPYQPAEKKLKITRHILEVCLEHQHPVSIITKGSLVLRDLDLLSELATLNLSKVVVSLTTLSNDTKAKLEPRTASPTARLRVIRETGEAGVPVNVMLAPMIPFVNDHELEELVSQCAEHSIMAISYILLRLPLGVAALFRAWLQEHYPLRAERVMNTIQASRGGKDYKAGFGTRMRGEGVFADLLSQRFRVACKRHGLSTGRGAELSCQHFRSAANAQQELF
ncbi:MAG: PA0069 family radical SAM protein [Pseudomonadota bacterium]